MSLNPPGLYVGNRAWPLFVGDKILCLCSRWRVPHYHRVTDTPAKEEKR